MDPDGPNRALFETLASLTNTMLFVTDLEANASLWVNDALVRATGYTLDDYRFQRFENPYIPAEDVARVVTFLTTFLEGGERISEGFVRNRFVDRWGGTLHVRTRVAHIHWDGQPALLYATTLERTDDDAVDVQARYRSLVEAATDCIVRLRPDLTVHYSNSVFQGLVGRTPVQLSTTAFPDLVALPFRKAVHSQLMTSEARVHVCAPVDHSDGGMAWLDGTFVRIEGGDDVGLLQAVLRDTTERRRLDARVQEAQRRESLGAMAGGVAHDMNNILTGILGSAALAQEDVDPHSDVARALSDIRLAAERAGELSSAMLAYAGEGNIERVTVDVAELVGEMRPLISSALRRGVALEVEVPDQPILVRADEVQLRQVVLNLIVNGADAIDGDHGVVRVSARRVRPADHVAAHGERVFGTPPTSDEMAEVRVSDAGRGMAADVLARIFDPFFSTKGKGRGLGLAAAIGILDRHGGCARVVTEPEWGTVVRVWLPLTDQPLPARPPETAAVPVPEGTRLLVVDDEPSLRRFARRALEPMGFEVVEADCGEQALDLVSTAGPFLAVILDQNMPGMGGDRAHRAIREAFPQLPVIRTSGFTADPRVSEDDAWTTFLGKPYGVRQLIDAVTDIMARRP